MSSPFASQHTKTIHLPDDPDQSIVIRRLPGRHLEKAQAENTFSSFDAVRRMGGARVQKELQEVFADDKKKAEVEQAQKDPLRGYDRDVLLYKGIVSWSYPESLEPQPALSLDGVTKAIEAGDLKTAIALATQWAKDGGQMRIPAIDDLDAESSEFIAREILRLSRPSLFQTEAETEDARKNG